MAAAWRDDRAGNADVRARRAVLTGTDHFGMAYDGLERLTAVIGTNPESFTMDAASNITARTGPNATNTYDTANRLTSDGAQTYVWAPSDRLSSRGGDTFSYDALDRITGSSVSGVSRTYSYDGDGLLASRTDGATISFVWDPSSAPGRLMNVGADHVVYGLGPIYTVRGDGSTDTLARDGMKSVRVETSNTGATTASFRYRAYGQIAQSFGASSPTSFGYAGQLLDPSGLLFMRARWYDPVTGRFLSRDPATPSFADPDTLNAYGYAASNPGLVLDPTGMCPIGWCFATPSFVFPYPSTVYSSSTPLPPRYRGIEKAFLNKENDDPGEGKPTGDDGSGEGAKPGEDGTEEPGGEQPGAEKPGAEKPGAEKPKLPDDPTQAPGPGWVWKGQPGSKPGSGQGSWVKPKTGEKLWPGHVTGEGTTHGPHWDYIDPDDGRWRGFPDGSWKRKF